MYSQLHLIYIQNMFCRRQFKQEAGVDSVLGGRNVKYMLELYEVPSRDIMHYQSDCPS